MASKLQNISALSNEIGKSLADYEKWTAFLKSAAWQYKYPFQDQILIYAQRPDATACASIDVWNKKLKAWINRGSKGIALLREGDRGKYLDYVFDISDTGTREHPTRTQAAVRYGFGSTTTALMMPLSKRLKIHSVS